MCARAARLREPPLDAVHCRVRAVRAKRATDRRSDSGVPAVRAATEDGYHDGIFVVTLPSPTNQAGLFKRRLSPPPCATEPPHLPLPPPLVTLRRRSLSPPTNHSTSFPRPQCTSRGHVLSKPASSSPFSPSRRGNRYRPPSVPHAGSPSVPTPTTRRP
jgi:hypothetical protein